MLNIYEAVPEIHCEHMASPIFFACPRGVQHNK